MEAPLTRTASANQLNGRAVEPLPPGAESFIEVTVVEAKDLLAADLGGTSDPYAMVYSGQHKFRTKTIPKTLQPKWNETFKIPTKGAGFSLQIGVFDQDMMNKDDFLGMVFIPLKNFSQSGVLSDGWFPLVDRPRDSEKRAIKGLVRLQIVRHYKLADFFADVPPPTDEEISARKATKELGLSSKRLGRLIRRLQAIAQLFSFAGVSREFDSIIWWTNPIKSVAVWMIWVYVCWKVPGLWVALSPLVALIAYMLGNFVVRVGLSSAPKDFQRVNSMPRKVDDDDEEEFDVLDDKVLRMETENQMKLLAEEDPSKAHAAAKVNKSESNESFVTKLRNVKSTLNDVSDQIDAVVGVVERFQGILQWRDPAVSQSFLLVLAALVVVIMFVPIRIALIAGGSWRIWKFWLKPEDHRKRRYSSPSPLYNLLQHSPTTADLYLNSTSVHYALVVRKEQ